MLRRCSNHDRDALLGFLREEPAFNTFLIADIENHGFDSDFQAVFAHTSEPGGEDDSAAIAHSGAIDWVALTFFNNLLVAGDPKAIDANAIAGLVSGSTDTVMGKWETLEGLLSSPSFTGRFPHLSASQQTLYSLATADHLRAPSGLSVVATPSDVDRIYEFLMSIPEFRTIYGDKNLVTDRVVDGNGTDLYRSDEHGICAHVNTAARTETTVMMGGLAVRPELRHRGYAQQILSELCRREIDSGFTPCLFSKVPYSESLYSHIGFEELGSWGVIGLNRINR